ncbi:MAG: flagellar basal body rod protein FlgC [Planctomycetaceae bacterium]
MSMQRILSGTEISASGLTGERIRMEVAANNIANMNSTRTAQGGPYQRQQVTFSAAMDQWMNPEKNPVDGLRGVDVVAVSSDTTPGPVIYDPGHPDADATGHVRLPNVNMSREMVDLVSASRAYEANLKSLETFRQMAEQALSLLRGLR